jgi:hypothetical protein
MSQENVEGVRDLFDRFNAFMRVELTSAAYAEPLDPEIQLHWRDEQNVPRHATASSRRCGGHRVHGGLPQRLGRTTRFRAPP